MNRFERGNPEIRFILPNDPHEGGVEAVNDRLFAGLDKLHEQWHGPRTRIGRLPILTGEPRHSLSLRFQTVDNDKTKNTHQVAFVLPTTEGTVQSTRFYRAKSGIISGEFMYPGYLALHTLYGAAEDVPADVRETVQSAVGNALAVESSFGSRIHKQILVQGQTDAFLHLMRAMMGDRWQQGIEIPQVQEPQHITSPEQNLVFQMLTAVHANQTVIRESTWGDADFEHTLTTTTGDPDAPDTAIYGQKWYALNDHNFFVAHNRQWQFSRTSLTTGYAEYTDVEDQHYNKLGGLNKKRAEWTRREAEIARERIEVEGLPHASIDLTDQGYKLLWGQINPKPNGGTSA